MANVEPEFGGILHLRLPYLPPHRTERTSQRMGLDTCLNECRSLKNFRCCSVGFFCFVLFILLQHTPPQLKSEYFAVLSGCKPCIQLYYSVPENPIQSIQAPLWQRHAWQPTEEDFQLSEVRGWPAEAAYLGPKPQAGVCTYIYIFFFLFFVFFCFGFSLVGFGLYGFLKGKLKPVKLNPGPVNCHP